MSKPTIVQSLLNQPSKTYRTTENGKKDYYSTRQEMLRIAADAHETTDDDDDDDSDDLDVFFTPNQSPRTSMASSAATMRRPSRRSLNADNLVPEPAPSLPVAVPSTRTPATTSTTRANHALSSASLTSTTLDAHSIYSSADSTWHQPKPKPIGPPVRTNSNGSPANPPSPKLPSPRQPHTFSAFASIASTTTSSTTPPAPARPAAQNTPKPRIPPPPSSAPPPKPTMAAGPKTSAQRRPPPTVITTTTTTTNPKPHPQPTRRHPSPPSSSPSPSPPPTTRKKPTPVKPPGSMLSALGGSGMGALLEEDEDGPLTPRMASRALGSDLSDSDAPPPGWDANLYPTPRSLRHTSRSSAPSANNHSYSNGTNASPPVRRRRSRSRSSDPDPDRSSSSSSSTTTTTTSRPHSHSTINGNGSSTTRAPKTLSAEVHALVSTFVSTGELPSNGTPGYTSLVLPRAPPPNPTTPGQPMNFNPMNVSSGSASDKVDLTLTGLAQRTMASVEITRGLGSRAGSGMLSKLGLNLKRSSTTPSYVPRGASDASLSKPSFATTASPLSFTAYRAPPTHVPSGSVLVQVWAVGLDAVDARLVGVGFRRGPEIGVDLFGEGNVRSNANGNMNGNANALAEPPTLNHSMADSQWTEADDIDQEADDEDVEDLNTTPSTSSTSPPRKNTFASLGRSLSLRLSRSSPSKPGNARNNANSNSKLNSNSSNLNVNSKGTPSKPSVRPPSASVSFSNTTSTPNTGRPDISRPKRSFSLKRNNTDGGNTSTTQSWAGSGSGTPSKSKSKPQTPGSTPSASPAKLSKSPPQTNSKAKETLKKKDKEKPRPVPLPSTAQVGYIPGRSFVGRVVHCGWDVGEEAAKKGDWVVGLLDVRKAGALTEFIVVDRHRVHRVPHPRNADARGSSSNGNGTAHPTNANGYTNGYTNTNGSSGSLTLEQLALLPLTGLAAYRAVRTFVFAFAPASHAAPGPGSNTYPPPTTTPSTSNNTTTSAPKSHPEHPPPPLPRRRALVLLGHTSTGALATQLLISRGWRVSLQAPFSAVGAHTPQSASTSFMAEVETRARAWGADEVIFDDGEEGGMDGGRGAVVRVLEAVRDDGDIFDGVLDTLGGKEVWVAAERLLSLQGPGGGGGGGEGGVVRRGSGQFTTVVGHCPERVVPSARDNWKAGLRALRMGSGSGAAGASAGAEESNVKGQGKVGYAWVSVAQDVDWEGEDVSETLGKVIRLALEEGIVPVVEDVGVDGKNQSRVWSFEQAPMAFVDNGPLVDGGTIVVRIA